MNSNLYVAYQGLDDDEANLCLVALHETFEEFKIKLEDYPKIGNILLRLAHYVLESNNQIITDDDPTANWLIRLYESYQQKANTYLEENDKSKIRIYREN